MPRGYHTPVLVAEVLDALGPPLGVSGAGHRADTPADLATAAAAEHPTQPRVLVDVTCGGAGHTRALLEATRPDTVIALDRDRDAIAWADEHLRPRADALGVTLHLIHAPFAELGRVLDELGVPSVSAILADLGVSSHQLDERARGFSFRGEAPLDMRMDQSRGPTAAEALTQLDQRELTRILREYGEESDAPRIARAILQHRPKTTAGLADIVAAAMSARQRRKLGARIHPATRTFQALRIHVNGELDQLRTLLEEAPTRLQVGGRFAAISFHSLEDRLVKRCFSALSRPPQLPRGLPITAADAPRAAFTLPAGLRSGVTPGEDERSKNPRSRSSRLRVLERLHAPERDSALATRSHRRSSLSAPAPTSRQFHD